MSDGWVSCEGDGHAHTPWGFAGGSNGYTSQLILKGPDGQEMQLPSMLQTRPAKAGDCYIAIGGSGGGYGNPFERVPDRVLNDYLDGYITCEEAREKYGVAITKNGQLDSVKTKSLRQMAHNDDAQSEVNAE